MVEGIYQGNFDQKIALFTKIGDDHLGKNLSQKTTNFLGRALSSTFSKNSNNAAVSNLIADIRQNPEFGDKYADMAQSKLGSLVGRGKPLTGRVAAQVLSEIKVTKANIGINIEDYVGDHAKEIMKTAFEEEQAGIGKSLMSQEDKAAIKEEAIQTMKAEFRGSSPSAARMKSKLTAVARKHCRIKIMNYNSTKIKEGTASLKNDIKVCLGERGENGIELSDKMIAAMKSKITGKLDIAYSEGTPRLYDSHDPAIESAKKKVVDSTVEAFTCISEAEGVPENVKDLIKTTLLSATITLTKNISLSVLQGVRDGLCDRIAAAVNSNDRSDSAVIDLVTRTESGLAKACKDPKTGACRSGIDGDSLATVLFSLLKLAMKANNLDKGEGQEKARSFYDAGVAAKGRQEDSILKSEMTKIIPNIALAADLRPQLDTEKFLHDNPGIPLGAKDMIQDIFTNIPIDFNDDLQREALDLVKEHATSPKGLPVDARVVIDRTDPGHPKPVLSFDSTNL